MVCCRAVWFAACDDRLQASAPDPDRSKETIWNRGIRGRADSPFLTQYALKFGRIQQQIHAHFVEEQAEFVRMFSQSVMNKRLFENAGCLDNIIEAAYTFWLERPDTERVRFHTTGA